MKSTAFVTNLLNAPLAKKEKRLRVFTHPYFSTSCGKISGKSKNTLRRRIFSSVEKQNDFQHFSKKGMLMFLSGRIFSLRLRSISPPFSRCFPFPHFFAHFFLFHSASFQEFPQAILALASFHNQ